MVEDIVIDKNKGKKQTANQNSKQTDSQVGFVLCIDYYCVKGFCFHPFSLYDLTLKYL